MTLDQFLKALLDEGLPGATPRLVAAALLARELVQAHDKAAADAAANGLQRLATSIRARRKAIEREMLECVQAEGARS